MPERSRDCWKSSRPFLKALWRWAGALAGR
jgi:hypothetical protein